MTLEEILQQHFNCKRPFNKDGSLTKQGDTAVNNLITLLEQLQAIGVINGAWNARRIIDHGY